MLKKFVGFPSLLWPERTYLPTEVWFFVFDAGWFDGQKAKSSLRFMEPILWLKVHMNRKFFLCRYKLSPLKYTISKFETFGMKIGDVTGVQSYAFGPEKWSSNRAAKRPKCHVMWRNFGCTISSISSMAVLFHIFQPSPGSLKPFESLDIV